MRSVVVPLVLLLAALAAVAGAAHARGDPNVAALQVALRARGVYDGTIDGVAGRGTAAAVASFQARRGLIADGIAGRATKRALKRRGRPRLGSRVIVSRSSGWDVAGLQFLLAWQGFPSGAIDGRAGPRTIAAVVRFQRWAGLPPDGLAGRGTIAALRRAPPRSILRFVHPVVAPIGDRFGPRGNRFHTGVDYTAPRGRSVTAAGRGCVEAVGYEPGYGRYVIVRHRLGMTSWYAHLNTVTIDQGDCVVAGNRIGTVGSTGRSTGPHLHFELRVRGAAVDPLSGL